MEVGDWVTDRANPEWGVASVLRILNELKMVEVQFWDEPRLSRRYFCTTFLVKV